MIGTIVWGALETEMLTPNFKMRVENRPTKGGHQMNTKGVSRIRIG